MNIPSGCGLTQHFYGGIYLVQSAFKGHMNPFQMLQILGILSALLRHRPKANRHDNSTKMTWRQLWPPSLERVRLQLEWWFAAHYAGPTAIILTCWLLRSYGRDHFDFLQLWSDFTMLFYQQTKTMLWQSCWWKQHTVMNWLNWDSTAPPLARDSKMNIKHVWWH